MKHLLLTLLLAAALPCAMARADDSTNAPSAPPDELSTHVQNTAMPPLYVKVDKGFVGFWPHGNQEYVQFNAYGKAVSLQDAFHLLLNPNQGMMLSYVDKAKFRHMRGGLLKAHLAWELKYWRERLGEVHDKNRPDLMRGRKGMRVTEVIVPEGGGKSLHAYMISLAGPDGVYVFSISPVTHKDDAMVKTFIASIQRIRHPLNIGIESRMLRSRDEKADKHGK